jgi:hypothetical protein
MDYVQYEQILQGLFSMFQAVILIIIILGTKYHKVMLLVLCNTITAKLFKPSVLPCHNPF